jgi:hypothetical protein
VEVGAQKLYFGVYSYVVQTYQGILCISSDIRGNLMMRVNPTSFRDLPLECLMDSIKIRAATRIILAISSNLKAMPHCASYALNDIRGHDVESQRPFRDSHVPGF